jgi:hypothetical protein
MYNYSSYLSIQYKQAQTQLKAAHDACVQRGNVIKALSGYHVSLAA